MHPLARTAPAAVLAVAVLTSFAPNPTLVSGDPVAGAGVGALGVADAAPPSNAQSPAAPPAASSFTPSGASTAGTSTASQAAPPPRPPSQGVEPVRVRIPAIGVDAATADLGLNDDGTIEVPSNFDDAGWWNKSPQPGRTGASAILGHVDSKAGPAVFFRLKDLKPGDRIYVDGESGDTVTFAVRSLEQYPKASFPSMKVFGATPEPTLRLITCGGTFDQSEGSHLDNIIAFADLVPAT